MSVDRDRMLDEEGVPDLDGPLPEKLATGDAQEGAAPPNEAPRGSVDYGTTPAEQRRREPLEQRLAREEPEIGGPDSGRPLVQATDPHGTGLDDEPDLVAEEVPVDGTVAAEEEALRIEDQPD